MNRIKVVNEPAELVPILRAVDTEVKRKVLKALSEDWLTEAQIEEEFGEPGVQALHFFEKSKLVEVRWQSGEGQPEKSFHSFYSSFHINTSSPLYEISDVLAAAVMADNEYEDVENRIYDIVGQEGKFAGDVAEELGVSQTMLKGLVKRSPRLDLRGHRIERFEG